MDQNVTSPEMEDQEDYDLIEKLLALFKSESKTTKLTQIKHIIELAGPLCILIAQTVYC